MRWPRWIGLVLLVCAVIGCGRGTPAPARSDGPATTVSPAPSTTSPAGGASVTPTGPLVSFGRQGGLAGVDEQLIVQHDGRYAIARRGRAPVTGQLAASELSSLQRTLDTAHFTDIPAVNPGKDVADGFTYHVVYAGHEVLAEDGDVPPALSPVIGALTGVLQRHSA